MKAYPRLQALRKSTGRYRKSNLPLWWVSALGGALVSDSWPSRNDEKTEGSLYTHFCSSTDAITPENSLAASLVDMAQQE